MTEPDTANGTRLSGLRILVAEDEVAISMLLEDMLGDFGSEVVGPAGRLADAVRLAETAEYDLAILDVNLAGEPIYPVVDAVNGRGIRFLFSTGYGAAGINDPWRDRPVLQKPFSQAELERALLAAVA